MSLRILIAVATVAILITGTEARAQSSDTVREPPPPEQPAPPADPVKSVLGAWEFSNSARDRRCNVVLKDERAAVGLQVEFDPVCAETFPFLKEVVGWRNKQNDFLRFLDASGKSILDFSELETGLFEALLAGEGVLFLQNAASLGPPPKSVADVAGEWMLQRAGKNVCTLTLTKKVLGPEALALAVKPGCDPAVVRFELASWHMDRGELVLTSQREETWRFEEADAKTWRRIPERAGAVLLVKP